MPANNVEPFYCPPYGVWLLPITKEQADELFRDAKLWYRVTSHSWFVDSSPEHYDRQKRTPSSYNVEYAVEVRGPDDVQTG